MENWEDFQKISELLKSNKIKFWLDGNTLRVASSNPEQALGNQEIEVGMYYDNMDELEELITDIKALGFQVKRLYYKRELFQIDCNYSRRRNILINIYRIVNNTAYCPKIREPLKKEELTKQMNYYCKLIGQKAIKGIGTGWEISHFFIKPFFKLDTLMIPSKYFDELDTVTIYKIPVPNKQEEYLATRYIYDEVENKESDSFLVRSKPDNLILEKEYDSFTEILHQHNIPYTMDSGVLLAIMREGKIFDFEKDVDLQMWLDDEQKIRKIIPELNAMGWVVTLWMYKGLLYQFRIQRPKSIPIHIMLFRKHENGAWCPSSRATGNPFKFPPAKRLYSLFSFGRKRLRNRLIATDISRWPWSVRRETGTWWVPAHFFEQREFNEVHQVYIPKDWDQYLTYRYGKWRVPAENWNFWLDDGAMKQELPEKLVDFKSYPEFSSRKL